MGIYLNPGNEQFKKAVSKTIYVDKSLLIDVVSNYARNINNSICVSRPRRFGKSTDADMLVAYYSKGCDSHELFDFLNISKVLDYLRHLNHHNVISLNMQRFLSTTHSIEGMINKITRKVTKELKMEYADYCDETVLSDILSEIYAYTSNDFIFIVDEWDCVFRECRDDKEGQRKYLDFLRNLFKDQPYVSLAYMTGILPIKKYGTHSALNMFKEISTLNPTPLENFMGFTEGEVKVLCDDYDADYQKMKEWYDGYRMSKDIYVYNHRSVVFSLTDHKYENYWNNTESYEALSIYINMNFDGLKEDIIKMLSGEKVDVYIESFNNDMTSFETKDDVLTLLIHLGYLTYDSETKQCFIPNQEVKEAFVSSIRNSSWKHTTKAIKDSKDILEATWKQDEEKVAKYIEQAHLETNIFQYNDEDALSYTLSLAYYIARDEYTIIKEMPTGKGRADLVFIPKKDKPAMIIELKWNKTKDSAIKQIKEKQYMYGLEHYLDNLLLIGINYDDKTKKHTCKIEKYK